MLTDTDNAYVSGLSEELGFHGNELVHFQTMYTVGAVVGQVPFGLIFPKVRMNWLIPGLDLGWGLFTLLQYRTQTASEMMAYRFLVVRTYSNGRYDKAFLTQLRASSNQPSFLASILSSEHGTAVTKSGAEEVFSTWV